MGICATTKALSAVVQLHWRTKTLGCPRSLVLSAAAGVPLLALAVVKAVPLVVRVLVVLVVNLLLGRYQNTVKSVSLVPLVAGLAALANAERVVMVTVCARKESC